jgi:hypothetical protein
LGNDIPFRAVAYKLMGKKRAIQPGSFARIEWLRIAFIKKK